METLTLPLPFDGEDDGPVPFVLTGLARREVTPERVPALRVVGLGPATGAPEVDPAPPSGLGAEEDGADPHDTRPAQARALRRSGMPVPTIAAAIGVEATQVEVWVTDVEPVRRRRARSTAGTAPRTSVALPAAPDAAWVGARACELRSTMDPLRLGLVAGLARAIAAVEGDLVSIVNDDVEVVARLVDLLREDVPIPTDRLRVALRVSAPVAIDRVRADVARLLGVDSARVVAGRAPTTGGVVPGAGARIEIRVDVRSRPLSEHVLALRAVPLLSEGEVRERPDVLDPTG